MDPKILTNEDYIKILQERFKADDIEIQKVEWNTLSENIEGYMGDHYILKITFKIGPNSHTESFFIKTKPSKNEYQKNAADQGTFYLKESFLYSNLFKQYEKMGFYTQFAPKCYLVKNETTLIMEDLIEINYKLTGRQNFYDKNHIEAALRSLAYFHGNYIALEETKSKELGRSYRINEEYPEAFENVLFKENDTESVGAKYIQSSVDCIVGLAKIFPETQKWKDDFQNKFQNFNYLKIINQDLPYRKTNTHFDLWCNNMLFSYSNGVPTNCRLVDYQALYYHHFAYDALLIIHSNTRKELRKDHFKDLLNYYYNTLEGILKEHGFNLFDIFPKEHFEETVKIFHAVALMQSICGRTMTFLPVEITNDAVNSGGDDIGDIIEGSRVQLVSKCFKKGGIYREILMEDIYELYELL